MIITHKPHDICEISSPYGERIVPYSGFHYGVDIRARIHGVNGDNIYAVSDGVVKLTKYDADGYGNYIVIQHNGFCSLYGHLRSDIVSVGQIVKSGQIIGYMGNTGHSTGTHLHFELRNCLYINFFNIKMNYGKRYCVDPLPFIKGVDKLSDVLTKVEAYNIVQNKTGFSDSTMFFLDCYKYADTLFIKLANFMNGNSVSNIEPTLNNAINILKTKASVSDDTIEFLSLYKFGDSLIIRLARSIT